MQIALALLLTVVLGTVAAFAPLTREFIPLPSLTVPALLLGTFAIWLRIAVSLTPGQAPRPDAIPVRPRRRFRRR